MSTPTLRSRPLFGAAMVCSFAASALAQTTVVLPCVADNTLYEDPTGSLSNAKGIGVFVGLTGLDVATRAVLRFDVAATIPAGATIVSARLTLEAMQSNYFGTLDVTGHRVLASWGEGSSFASAGGGGGGPSTTGDATWIHRFYPSTFWTSPGGDFAPASFVIATPPFGLVSSPSGPATVADVQFWLDNPAQDFGWLLQSNEALLSPTARRFASREATIGQKPSLTVSYLLPGDIGVWGTGCPTAFGTLTTAWGGPMIGGTSVPLLHTNAPPASIGINYFALDLYQPGGLIQPSCNLYLPITQSWIPGEIFLTDGAGVGSPINWPVPSIYPGLYFVTQSAVLDSSPFGLALSNAGVAVIQ